MLDEKRAECSREGGFFWLILDIWGQSKNSRSEIGRSAGYFYSDPKYSAAIIGGISGGVGAASGIALYKEIGLLSFVVAIFAGYVTAIILEKLANLYSQRNESDQ